MRKLLFLCALATLCIPICVMGEDACGDAVKAARTAGDLVEMKRILDLRQTPACVAKLILLRSNAKVSNGISVGGVKEALKNIQQNGASVGSGGGTSLVSKNITSRVLALANEYGALTESSNGDTTTISGTLDGIPLALAAHTEGLIAECPLNLRSTACLGSGTLDFLGRFSYSVAVNTSKASQLSGTPAGPSQGNAQRVAVKSTGTPATVSQVTGKYVILRPKMKFSNLITALSNLKPGDLSSGSTLAAAAERLRAFQKNAGQDNGEAWANWRDQTAEHLLTVPENMVVVEWEKQGDVLAGVLETNGAAKDQPTDAQLTQAALDFAAAFSEFGNAERLFFNAKLPNPILSFEYNNNRPPNQPTNSVFRMIYSQTAGGWTLSGNGAVSIYDSDPSKLIPGAQRLRDIQFGVEADHDLPDFKVLGKPTFSATYYLQDQTSPAILNVTPSNPVPGITFTGLSPNATQVFAQKGTINIGQFKITMGKASSGLRIPLAITFSNRTELINKADVRGQIGISYDFDSLFASSSNK